MAVRRGGSIGKGGNRLLEDIPVGVVGPYSLAVVFLREGTGHVVGQYLWAVASVKRAEVGLGIGRYVC